MEQIQGTPTIGRMLRSSMESLLQLLLEELMATLIKIRQSSMELLHHVRRWRLWGEEAKARMENRGKQLVRALNIKLTGRNSFLVLPVMSYFIGKT